MSYAEGQGTTCSSGVTTPTGCTVGGATTSSLAIEGCPPSMATIASTAGRAGTRSSRMTAPIGFSATPVRTCLMAATAETGAEIDWVATPSRSARAAGSGAPRSRSGIRPRPTHPHARRYPTVAPGIRVGSRSRERQRFRGRQSRSRPPPQTATARHGLSLRTPSVTRAVRRSVFLFNNAMISVRAEP